MIKEGKHETRRYQRGRQIVKTAVIGERAERKE